MKSLYVCLFSNGVIKIGRGTKPENRINAHRSHGATMGIEMVNHAIAECQGDLPAAERELIKWCAERCTKRMSSEWFIGVDYGQAVEKAKEFAANAYILTDAGMADENEKSQTIFKGIMAHFYGQGTDSRESEKWRQSLAVAMAACDMLTCGSSIHLEICEPQEMFGGISYLELMTAIVIHDMSRDYRAELMHDFAKACDDPEAIALILERLKLGQIEITKLWTEK